MPPTRMYVADWDGNGAYRLSPDGKQLMWSARKGLDQGLFVKNLETGVQHSYAVAWFCTWAEDSRHVLCPVDNGNENTQLIRLDTAQEGLAVKNLTPFSGAASGLHSTIEASDDLLITSNKRDAKVFDLYRYHAVDDSLELIAQNPGSVAMWIVNRQGKLLGRGRKEGSGWVYEALSGDSPTGTWQAAFSVGNSDSVIPLQLGTDQQHAWVLSNRGRDKLALTQLDLRNGNETVFFEDPRVDLSGAYISHKTGLPLAVTMDAGKPEWKFFDPQLEALSTQLQQQSDERMHILSLSRDERRMVVAEQGPTGGRYVLIDADHQTRTVLGEQTSSRIHAVSPLPRQRAITFTSRDGLPLHGYLTTPMDANGLDMRHVPTVVLVHGGPWARDFYWGDTMPFFLASRGYAVLQVNFRGSSGYGKAFQAASKGEFAGKMHTDLLDGIHYLVQQGISDPQKVAIMGASYGGYAALVGMTHTPGTFACGISVFGMSDLSSLISDAPPYWSLGLFQWHDYVGDPSKPEDLQRMREKSPLFKADQVQGPVLVLQGARDARVHLDQSTRMVDALRKAGKPVDLVVFPNAGHGLYRWIDRLTEYRKTEDFLAQCLGGRSNGFDFFELGSLIF